MSAHSTFPVRRRRRNLWTAAGMAVLMLIALFGGRALWMHGFTTGAVTAECLTAFEAYGPVAAQEPICLAAHDRYERDTLAWVMKQEAELAVRRDAADR